MPQTKHAVIRYRTIDRCLRNTRKRFFMDDLVEACNEVLSDYGTSVSKRQIHEDLIFMESEAGYSANIDRLREGHRVYFRYCDPTFTIENLPMTQQEMNLMKDTLEMLGRFDGLPQFSWINEIKVRFEDEFQLKDNISGAVSFAHNPYLQGLQLFPNLFDAIVQKNVLSIMYHRFGHESKQRIIHPYQLRQYNNRWFLIGLEERLLPRIPLAVVPLDRIDSYKVDENIIYQEYQGVDLDDHFSEIVGVSLSPEGHKETVVLKASYPTAEYIASKPMHHSQKIIERNKEGITFELYLIPNFELETIILSYADGCEIIAPLSLRQKIRDRAQKIIDKNQVLLK